MTDGPFEYDRHDDNNEPYPIKYDRFFYVGVNMFVGVNEYVSAVGFGQGPSPSSQARTGWDTCPSLASPVASLLYKSQMTNQALKGWSSLKGWSLSCIFL